MDTERKKVAADICTYVDEEKGQLHVEITVPGVAKDEIRLRLQDDHFNLIAPRENFDYVTTGSFCCPVKSSAASANYKDGLLKVSVPFRDPMEGAYEVPIN